MLQKPHKIPKPVVLCILDGWGHSEPGPRNAISQAKTPVYDKWWRENPRAFLKTSGEAVGLPAGQMGNSEVGHMNIGGGRAMLQDLPRINEAILTGEFDKNSVLNDLFDAAKKTGGALHIMGLMSPGGVHSHQDHLARVAELAAGVGITVWLHAFLDGRDTPPESAAGFVETLEALFRNDPKVNIATLTGRYYAMDRDKRWDRVERAYNVLVLAEGEQTDTVVQAITGAHENGVTDEFVNPTVIGNYNGMKDGDALLMANFRADRAREIIAALADPDFDGFQRKKAIKFSQASGMVKYSENLNSFMTALFEPVEVRESLGEVVSNAGLKQLRLAETEKYAHVTFFLNGGKEKVFEGEDRILIPSPKVATYDLKPEMSAPEVTEKLVGAIKDQKYDLIVVNFANPDMVGHTGKMDAAIKAVEVIDVALGEIERALVEVGGIMLLSADHGNIEQMTDPNTKAPHTAHTSFDVPVILVNEKAVSSAPLKLRNGKLADLAPTVLELLSLDQPAAMTGKTLLETGEHTKTSRKEQHAAS